MAEDEKLRLNRLRALAKRQGYTLTRSRSRSPVAPEYGRCMLTHNLTNTVALGGDPMVFNASLDDVERFLTQDRE